MIAPLENCTFYLGARSLNITRNVLAKLKALCFVRILWAEPFFGIKNMAALAMHPAVRGFRFGEIMRGDIVSFARKKLGARGNHSIFCPNKLFVICFSPRILKLLS